MYKRTKRIPTIIALMLIFAGLVGAIYLDRFSHTLESSAKSSAKPENIRFTNITDSSFTVSWLTDSPVEGMVEFLGQNQKKIILDDLDNDNISRKRTTHHVSVKNLKENNDYNVKLLSRNQCNSNEFCPTFSQKTISKQDINLNLPLSHGIIRTSEGKFAHEAIVYLVVGKGQPLSSRTDSSGLWAIPLNLLRPQPPLTKLEFSDNDLVQITANTSTRDRTTSIIDFKSLRQNIPVPDMQIGNSYNFIDLLSKKNQFASSNNQRVLGLEADKPLINSTFDILFPLQDGEVSPETRPKFRGIGPKGKEILITVNSVPQTGKVLVENDGTWSWRPPKDLPPGNHTITIGTIEGGKLISVVKKFIVLKSGERVLGEATTSATLSPTLTPSVTTPTVTLVPSSSNTPTPTLVVATPTYLPTTTAKPSLIITSPTYSPTITTPRTGDFKSTLILIGGGLTLFALGAKLLFLP